MTVLLHHSATRYLLGALLGGGFSALGVLLAGRDAAPVSQFHTEDFHVARPADDPLEVRIDRPIEIPYVYGDFDLFAEIELAADTDLDLLFRKVEPVIRDADLPLFHGRFGVLRVSTRAAGSALRSREQALFDESPRVQGGQGLAPGYPATVVIRARGRTVRVNVAGVWHGPFPTADAHGNLTLCARGGKVLVHRLDILRVARPLELKVWARAAGLGAAIGVALMALGVGWLRFVLGLLAVPLAGWLLGGWVFAHRLPETEPDPGALLLAGLVGVPVWLAVASGARIWWWLLALVAMVGMLEFCVRQEEPRLVPFEDPRLNAVFGWGSGSAPAAALERRLRARHRVHSAAPADNRVLFAGGGPLYEPADVSSYVGLFSSAAAGRALGEAVDSVVVPTIYSDTAQQLELLARYYLPELAPEVVVFGIPSWELEFAAENGTREVLQSGEAKPVRRWLGLLDLLWPRAAEARRQESPAASLGATLDRLATLALEQDFAVLLIDEPTTPAELRQEVDAAVAAHGMAHLRRAWNATEIESIAQALVPLLQRR